MFKGQPHQRMQCFLNLLCDKSGCIQLSGPFSKCFARQLKLPFSFLVGLLTKSNGLSVPNCLTPATLMWEQEAVEWVVHGHPLGWQRGVAWKHIKYKQILGKHTEKASV